MSDWSKILEAVAGGLLTGGASALTTVFATFRDLRNRVIALEARIGQPSEGLRHATGIHEELHSFNEKFEDISSDIRRVDRKIETWDDGNPPEWALKLVNRVHNRSSVNMELQQEFEARVEARLRSIQDRAVREYERITELERRQDDRKYVLQADYEVDSKRRASEISQVRENLASANGLLRGVLGAMGLIDGPSSRNKI
jgi:hypothetical protein